MRAPGPPRPDSRGLHLADGVGLGIQRLRVIDLETGDQPIRNEDGSVAVVLNGEIYNYRELRASCRSAATALDPRDTEVIAHLWEEGDDLASGSTGCSPSRSGTAAAQALSPATTSARSRSSTRCATAAVRLRDEGAAGRPLDPARARPRGARPLPRVRLRAGAGPSFARCGNCRPATLACEDGRRGRRYWRFAARARPRLRCRSSRRCASRSPTRCAAADRRRAARRVPLRRHRLGLVVALMAAASAAPAADLRDRLPPELQRAAAAGRGRALRHRAPRVPRRAGRVESCRSWSALRRAVRRLLGGPELLPRRATRREVTVALTGDGGDELFAGYLATSPTGSAAGSPAAARSAARRRGACRAPLARRRARQRSSGGAS